MFFDYYFRIFFSFFFISSSKRFFCAGDTRILNYRKTKCINLKNKLTVSVQLELTLRFFSLIKSQNPIGLWIQSQKFVIAEIQKSIHNTEPNDKPTSIGS